MAHQQKDSIYPPWPRKLSKEHLDFLQEEIIDWSLANGLAIRLRPDSGLVKEQELASATTAPVTVFPSLLGAAQYHEARKIQCSYNELYARIASDRQWLGGVVEELAPYDEFIANLWNIHLACETEGYAQDVSLGLFRSDYMIHQEKEHKHGSASLKQVEFNTIASSFGGLASKVSDLHRHLLRDDAYPGEAGTLLGRAMSNTLPSNPSVESLAAGLIESWHQYGPVKTSRVKCIIVIVQEPERNAFDQRHVEHEVGSQGFNIFRVPFGKVMSLTSIDSTTRALLYKPPAFPDRTYEVATVYYRAGYAPSEYEAFHEDGTPAFETQGWQARLHLERSAAIKCPSVLTHLAGCKKVQQILATPGSDHLARFVNSDQDLEGIRATFMPIHPLDDSEAGQEGRRLALDEEECQRFVLKPQREGGGNNIYRSKIPTFLRSQDPKAWAQYILMEMIETPPQRNYIMRDGVVEEGGVICELGCYGAVIWGAGGQIRYNKEAGTLLRTKGDQSEEGGVAAGFGAVDSPCLVEV